MENRNSYEDFQKDLLNTVSEELNQQGGYQCELTQAAKNNVVLTGISIRQEGSMTASVFYLENVYQQYQRGKPLDQIGRELLAYYQKIGVPVFEVQEIRDYEKIKDRLRLRLVNRENNNGFYKQGPYRLQPLGAEVLYAELEHSQEGSFSMHITNAIAENWGIPKQELFAAALENTQEHDKVSFVSMDEMIRELVSGEKTGEETAEPMYVLTNERQEHGATVTSYPGVLEQIRERLGEDFYILPSSTHEVIILPKKFGIGPKEMRSIVKEINAEMVEPQEILSNEVYEFQGKTNKVKKCRKEERER